MARGFLADERAQVATEYLLIVAIGIAVVVAGAVLATRMLDFVNWASWQVSVQRNATIAMLK